MRMNNQSDASGFCLRLGHGLYDRHNDGRFREGTDFSLALAESGTWSGSSKWPNGMYGAASTSYDFNDASHGACAFVISNTVAGQENKADWRCELFSSDLRPEAPGPSPFVRLQALGSCRRQRKNIHVMLRFWDSTGTNYVGGRDSQCRRPHRRFGHDQLPNTHDERDHGSAESPDGRCYFQRLSTADEPWTSGTARFDDFSVTTVPRSLLFKAGVGAAILLAVGALTGLLIQLWRRCAGRNRVAAPGLP